MKNMLPVSLLLLMLLFLVGCSDTGTLSYRSAHGFEVDYLDSWTQSEVLGTVVFTKQGSESLELPTSVNVITQDLSANPMTLDELTDASLVQLKVLISDFDLIISKEAVLGGEQGYEVVYTGRQGAIEFKAMQRWIVYDNSAYIVTYISEIDSFATNYYEVRDMINSFELK